jgi:hypothetical protein
LLYFEGVRPIPVDWVDDGFGDFGESRRHALLESAFEGCKLEDVEDFAIRVEMACRFVSSLV